MTAHYVGHQSLPPAAHAHVALANAFPRVSRSPTPQSAAAEHLPHELRLRVVELRARRARSSSATSAWSSSSTGAQDRLLKANGWLTQGLSAETLQMLYGPGGADLGLSGWQPPVLDDPHPREALERASQRIREAFCDYQRLADERRGRSPCPGGRGRHRLALGHGDLGPLLAALRADKGYCPLLGAFSPGR
jgi:hypothetical protein